MPLEESEYFLCPYCGANNALAIDMTGGAQQNFVIDCETCCAPILARVKVVGEDVLLEVKKENE